jgi:hypothetical protein
MENYLIFNYEIMGGKVRKIMALEFYAKNLDTAKMTQSHYMECTNPESTITDLVKVKTSKLVRQLAKNI